MASVNEINALYSEAIAIRNKAEQFYKENKAKIPPGEDAILWNVDKWFWDNYKAFQAKPGSGYADAARLGIVQYQAAFDRLKSFAPVNWAMWAIVAVGVVIAGRVWLAKKR